MLYVFLFYIGVAAITFSLYVYRLSNEGVWANPDTGVMIRIAVVLISLAWPIVVIAMLDDLRIAAWLFKGKPLK